MYIAELLETLSTINAPNVLLRSVEEFNATYVKVHAGCFFVKTVARSNSHLQFNIGLLEHRMRLKTESSCFIPSCSFFLWVCECKRRSCFVEACVGVRCFYNTE